MFDLKFLLFISTGTLLAVAISANHTTTTTTVIGFPELEANSTVIQPELNSGEEGDKFSTQGGKESRSISPNEEDDYYEDEDDEDGEEGQDSHSYAPESVCTAGYFLDRIIPEDYPYEISKNVNHINETIERLNRMYSFSTQMFEKMRPFIREMGLRIVDFLVESQLDPECMGALFRVINALSKRQLWATSFLDSSGQIFSGGFQQGKFASLGEFDQCLEIKGAESDEREPIYGQYCLIRPVVPVPEDTTIRKDETIAHLDVPEVNRFLNDRYLQTYLGLYKFYKGALLQFGLCLPHQCKPANVEAAINQLLVRKTGLSVEVGPKCAVATDEIEFNMYQAISIFIFGMLAILVIASTVYEVIYRWKMESCSAVMEKPSIESSDSIPMEHNSLNKRRYQRQMSRAYVEKPLPVQLFTTFSLIRNTRVLFEMPANRRFLPIDTMRLFFILYFFITNAYYFTLIFAPMIVKRFYVNGPMQFMTEKKYFFMRLYYIHDYFLALSGLSVALMYRAHKFNILEYLSKTYVKYVLPVLASIGLIYIFPLLGSGPLWHLFDETVARQCQKNILSNLLFYNNLNENIEEICNLPTAFVSLIFQMKLVAPMLLLIISHFRPKTGAYILTTICLATISLNLIPRFYFNYLIPYEYKKMNSFSEIKQSIVFYNFNPVVHLSPFIFGMALGRWIIATIDQPKCQRHYQVAIAGITSFLLTTASMAFMEQLKITNPSLPAARVAVMLSVGKLVLISFFCWLVYACIMGHITIVNRFLCSIAFRPTAQLSFGFFLTSILVFCLRIFSIREPIVLSANRMFRDIVSDAVIAFFLAYLIHLMIQQPTRNLFLFAKLWRRKVDQHQYSFRNRSTSTPNSNHYFDASALQARSSKSSKVSPIKCQQIMVEVDLKTSDVNNNHTTA